MKLSALAKVTSHIEEKLCIGIAVITQLYLQLYITYQLHVSDIRNETVKVGLQLC